MPIARTPRSRVLAGLVAALFGTATLTAVDVRSAAAQFDLGAGLRALGGGQNAGRGSDRARPGAAA
ncbi:MAG: hypothetical protein ACT6XY_21685, partial [Phreatobacter sp.]|uniref:hypothetical protein n=1 Tax=Phreatobacter sp. TaxID=1966341 RepID=UPI0040358A67